LIEKRQTSLFFLSFFLFSPRRFERALFSGSVLPFFFARIGRSDLTKKLAKVGPFECDELEKHCRVSAKCYPTTVPALYTMTKEKFNSAFLVLLLVSRQTKSQMLVINIRFWNLSRNPDKNPQKKSELRRTKIRNVAGRCRRGAGTIVLFFFSFLCGAGTMPAQCRQTAGFTTEKWLLCIQLRLNGTKIFFQKTLCDTGPITVHRKAEWRK